MTTPKTPRKPPARPRAGKKNKAAAVMAEIQAALPNPGAMQAFHAADALTKEMYPIRVFDTRYTLRQMLSGLTTAMNLYSTAYLKGLELVKTHVLPTIKDNAVFCAINTVTEEQLIQLNQGVMGMVDVIGMPLTVRAPFVRDVTSVTHFVGLVRNEFYHLERPMSIDDVSRYFYNAFFSMTPVRLFLTEHADYSTAIKELLGMCGPALFLEFANNEVDVLNGTNPIIMTNPLWRLAMQAHAELTDALTQLTDSTIDSEGSAIDELAKVLDGSGNHASAHGQLVDHIALVAEIG